MKPKFLSLALIIISSLATAIFTTQCSPTPTPKPRGYFRITLPEHEYSQFVSETMPYSFERSTSCRVMKDDERGAKETWSNIYYPTLNCKIHLTYLSLNTKDEEFAYEDSHQFAYKHTVVADAIGERYYEDPQRHVYATFYEIKGNAASPSQFAITDSLGNFFRGSLYFYCRPNKDSLAPVIAYINEDINHLIETFNWTNQHASN